MDLKSVTVFQEQIALTIKRTNRQNRRPQNYGSGVRAGTGTGMSSFRIGSNLWIFSACHYPETRDSRCFRLGDVVIGSIQVNEASKSTNPITPDF